MATLFVLIVSGIAAALFATQNTLTTTITFGQYLFSGIPVYIIALGGLLIGIFLSLIISFFKTFISSMEQRSTNNTLSSLKRENTELTKQVHKLELENTKLITRLGEQEDDNSI